MKMQKKRKLESRFPLSLFGLYLGVLLLMSGIHTGLVTLVNENQWHSLIQIAVPSVYWTLVAAGLTYFTKSKIVKTYDQPMKELAKAAEKVAQGDFSVYVPPLHTSNHHDYLDLMFLDFNKMVAELGSIETMRTDFIANVSHEIKTPLAAIQNYAQLLRKPGLAKEEQDAYISAILGSTHRLSALVTNILKLNKLESQQIAPQMEAYDLCRQLSDCALGFESVWEEKEIDFEAEMEDRTVIRGDESLMELVWNNLLSNAFKFTEPGGRVSLIQTSDGETVTVCVSDTGCGISKESRAHIFDKFYQGDTSHATEGNGLGLALIYRVLQLIGGSIEVGSEEGKGTAFTVKIPVGKRESENLNEDK